MAKIKKDTSLRKAILQAAITGQLISNVEGETETGKQLLDRIIEERKKMSHGLDFANAKSGKRKSKKETALASSNPCDIPEDEIPFEIPESWCWCRLGDLGDFLRGSGIKREETRLEGYPCIRYGEMYTKYKTVIKETVSFVEKEIFDKCQKIKTNDIVMSLTGENEYDIALAAVYLGEKVVAMGGDMTRFRPCLINSLFYVYAINSPYGIECKSQLATGNIIVHISNDKLSSILIPLPPLAVQNAIVAKLEEVLPLVDAYENAVLQKEELKNALPDKVKKAILQEAIQGKLTEEWRIEMLKQVQHDGRTEETGKQLLDRIIEERKKMSHGLDFANAKSGKRKSKKETALAGSNPCDIPEDEIPFEIPESWCWCRLGELGLYRKGPFGSSLTKSMFVPKSKSSIKVYEQKNAIQKDFSLGDYYISKEKFDSMQSFIVEPEDIIVSCAGTIGEVYKLPKNAPIGIINQALMRVKLYNDELSAFWMLYFDYVLKKEASKQSSGTAIKNIPPFEILKAYPFPLPPLAEQKKIVEIIEQMLPLCEKLGG